MEEAVRLPFVSSRVPSLSAVSPRVSVTPLSFIVELASSELVIEEVGNVCIAVQVFAWPSAREATIAPVVGDMVNVPSLLETLLTGLFAAVISTSFVEGFVTVMFCPEIKFIPACDVRPVPPI